MSNPFHNQALGLLILRLTTGVLLLLHGIAKVIDPSTALAFIEQRLIASELPDALAYGVYLGEVIGPIMVILGIYTRWGGLFIAINMAFAMFLVHSHEWLTLNAHGGWTLELQAFYLFSGLALVFLGSGKFAMRPG